MQSFLEDKSFNGAAKKLEEVCQYHVGDTCHSLSRVSLQPGGTECLVYTTMLGAVGAFVPFTSREDGALQPQSRRAAAFRGLAAKTLLAQWTSSRTWRCTCARSRSRSADATSCRTARRTSQ